MAAEARLRKAESILEGIKFNDRIANLKVHSLFGQVSAATGCVKAFSRVISAVTYLSRSAIAQASCRAPAGAITFVLDQSCRYPAG